LIGRSRELHGTTRLVSLIQIVCVVALAVLAFSASGDHQHHWVVVLIAAVGVGAGLYATVEARRHHRSAEQLARTVHSERALSATLEQAVAERTEELGDVQRVLERMWWLGQQITLELNPKRVLDRFLEAAVDVACADGGALGMASDDGRIRIVAGTGCLSPLNGLTVPVTGSAMGRVLRARETWSVPDASSHVPELYTPSYELVAEADLSALALIPVLRRGEGIGVLALATAGGRQFAPEVLRRVEAMSDLLSVALANAELVETLRQAEWRFRTLFRAAPDPVLTVLPSGRIREANDAIREILGIEPGNVVGRRLADLVVADDTERLEEALERTFGGTQLRLEVTMKGEPERGHRPVSLAMSRLPEADPPSVLIIGRDMTAEREMRSRLMETDRLVAVGELVAGVAHEVNNPLSSISAFAQLLLRDGGLTNGQRDSLEVIRSETHRASQVVRDLLAFARRSEPLREPIDLNGVITRTLRLRQYELTTGHVSLETDLADDLPPVVGDARQLQQVCLNLLTNSLQAMAERGSGKLSVTTRSAGGRVMVDWQDTGTGIPASARARVFEPFFTTKPEGEGTGLGLSVSYGIITAHSGTIEVIDTSSSGTTIRLALPAGDTAAAEDKARAQSGKFVVRSPLTGLKLLFVDDEQSLRSGMEAYGALRGFSVVTAPDGLAALERLDTTTVDAVVCDLRMPGLDGPGLLERLRAEKPGLANRIVFITGDVLSAGNRPATRQPILAKPFSFERLEEALVSVIRGVPYRPSVERA
jgi:two-component system, NtrC family, sensor kinase